MRQLRAIIVVSILLGIISLSIPLRFYGVMSSIFGSLTPPPFDFAVVRTFTFVFALPAITLILMGIALYYVMEKLEKVAELEVIRESGEVMGHLKKVRVEEGEVESFVVDEGKEIGKEDILAVDDTIIVKMPENEFEGKEVYTEVGEFLGYVKDVKVDENEEPVSIEVEKKDKKIEINVRDVVSTENVVIVKG
ncbi:MAG: PRC-barrel domain-containing protein [Candidatus Hydrothermarchaeales archaeon]